MEEEKRGEEEGDESMMKRSVLDAKQRRGNQAC